MSSSFYKAVFLMTLLYLWVGGALCAQSTQLHFKHFTTEDGLPSSEAYVVFEDHEGYIWIGTDNGVARYDGYEFEIFDSNDGLDDVVVFTILEDHSGKIWVGTFSGDAYYFEDGKFHPYRFNKEVQAARLGNEFVHLIDVQQDGEVVFRLLNSGLFIVGQGGEVRPLATKDPKDLFYYVPDCEGTRSLAPIKRNYPKAVIDNANTQKNKEETFNIVLGNESCHQEIGELTICVHSGSTWPIKFVSVVQEGSKKKLYFFDALKSYVLSEDGKQTEFTAFRKKINYILPASEDKLWVGLDGGEGLKLINVVSSGFKTEESHLEGRSITYIIQDQQGGMWVSTTDAGVFYCPFPNQRRHSVNPTAKALAIAVTGEACFYVSYSDGTFYQVDVGHRKAINLNLTEINKEYWSDYLLFDELSDKIYASFFTIDHVLIQNRRNRVDFIPYKGNALKNITGIRRMALSSFLGDRKGLIANFTSFGVFDLDSLTTDFVHYDRNQSVYAFYIDADGRYLLGALDGLMEYDPKYSDRAIRRIDLGVKELNTRVVAIEEYRGGVLFGTRGEGLIYLKDGNVQIVKEKDGMASNMVRDLSISDKGDVWVSSLNGLSKVAFGNDGVAVRTYRVEHGLVNNEIQDLDVYKDEIWLATSSGIQKFIEPPLVTYSPEPDIRQFIIDGDTVQTSVNMEFDAGDHNVSIFFNTINFALGDQILYRYQLEEGGEWQHTNQRKVNFPKLGPGEYSFAVSSQNEDKVWSKSTKVTFTIATPWHQTWWAWASGSLLMLSLVSIYFLRRERIRRREHNLLLQINKLEHEALHAQMNPHFVFNALNSIQNFVLHNDAKQAATYLARFALVIRQTLRSSVKGEHSLKDEVEMLKTYLLLEKLRFKEGFNYEITVAASLNQGQIKLPPLMIQPFVENAIIHGLSALEKGGEISVTFKGSSQALEVEIVDNGVGYDLSNSPDEESYGMEITRKRLAVMKSSTQKISHMQVESLYAEDGNLRGTSVSLLIYL